MSGGFVYRGQDVPELLGQYVFGDIANGRVFYVPVSRLLQGSQAQPNELVLFHQGRPTTLLKAIGGVRADLTFAQDAYGELLLVTRHDGKLRQIVGKGREGLRSDRKTREELARQERSTRTLRWGTMAGAVLIGLFFLIFIWVFLRARRTAHSANDPGTTSGHLQMSASQPADQSPQAVVSEVSASFPLDRSLAKFITGQVVITSTQDEAWSVPISDVSQICVMVNGEK